MIPKNADRLCAIQYCKRFYKMSVRLRLKTGVIEKVWVCDQHFNMYFNTATTSGRRGGYSLNHPELWDGRQKWEASEC